MCLSNTNLFCVFRGGDHASKIMSLKTFKAMLESGTDEEKTSLAKSGVMPLFSKLLRPLTASGVDDSDLLELRGLLVWTLNGILQVPPGLNQDLIIDTYVDAGVHALLVDLLRFVSPPFLANVVSHIFKQKPPCRSSK